MRMDELSFLSGTPKEAFFSALHIYRYIKFHNLISGKLVTEQAALYFFSIVKLAMLLLSHPMTAALGCTTGSEKDRLILTYWKKRKLKFSLPVWIKGLTKEEGNDALPGISPPAQVTWWNEVAYPCLNCYHFKGFTAFFQLLLPLWKAKKKDTVT